MLDGIEFLIRLESYNAVRYAKGGKLKNLFNALKEKIRLKYLISTWSMV